jgi:colicin import membrane protein
MKRLLSCLAMLACCLPVGAQAPQDDAAARAHIGAGRAQAEARYADEEKTCYGRFAVNDCLNEAKTRRRTVLADLRRQEIALNDAERKRRSAERLQQLEERNSVQKQQEAADQRAKALAGQHKREQQAAEKAAGRSQAEAKRAAGPKPAPPARKAAEPRKVDAAANVQSYEKKQQEAQQHKQRTEERAAEHKKAAAQPRPVPP